MARDMAAGQKRCAPNQDPKDDRGVLEGLRAAAAVLQGAEALKLHGRLLDAQPPAACAEVLQQLRAAQQARALTQPRSGSSSAAQPLQRPCLCMQLLHAHP